MLAPKRPPSTKEVLQTGFPLPVHILLSEPNNRWVSKTMIQHVYTGNLPEGSFISTKDGLKVSSPEFCFLQMAAELTITQLIELGFEFCGMYSIPNKGDLEVPDRGFYNRPPLTTTKRISEFIAQIPGYSGRKKAVRALQYISDGSASPMETKLAILLTLPYRHGGFGLPAPVLNARITPTKTERKSSGKAFYACDLFWPEHGLAVEYDSDLFHTGAEHIAEDSKKRNALTLMGVTVITVTTKQLYNRKEFEKTVRVIAKCLNKRLVYQNPEFAAVHHKLRNELLGHH